MVRIGISLYGLYPSPEVKPLVALRPAMSLHTRIAFVRKCPPTPPSATAALITLPGSRIATLPLGYADGYMRQLSGKASVLIRGAPCSPGGPHLHGLLHGGRHRPSPVGPGEPVVVFGRQGDGEISADELARLAGTINYEIVCAVSSRCPGIIRTRLDTSPIF